VIDDKTVKNRFAGSRDPSSYSATLQAGIFESGHLSFTSRPVSAVSDIVQVEVPTVGESISEVQIGNWLKSDGDWVAAGEDLVEIYVYWGFVEREVIQWPGKAYDSLVMTLALRPLPAMPAQP